MVGICESKWKGQIHSVIFVCDVAWDKAPGWPNGNLVGVARSGRTWQGQGCEECVRRISLLLLQGCIHCEFLQVNRLHSLGMHN